MKKQFGLTILLTILISMFGLKSLATNYYDIMVENEDGVAIYYCYVNDGKELFVASNYHETSSYKDDIVIPEEVTYMGKTRKSNRH